MKKLLLSQRALFTICLLIAGGILFNGCAKDDLFAESPDSDRIVSTRSSEGPGTQWMCRNTKVLCGFINPAWRDVCLACDEAYNPYHGGLMVEFFQKILKNYVEFQTGGPTVENINETTIQNRIIIPGGILIDYAPQVWYESAKTMKYYNDLRATLVYTSNRDYAEGVDIGWYRTVRMFYPGITNATTVESIHAKWIVSNGRYLKKTSNGEGLMAGTQAAVDAYKNR